MIPCRDQPHLSASGRTTGLVYKTGLCQHVLSLSSSRRTTCSIMYSEDRFNIPSSALHEEVNRSRAPSREVSRSHTIDDSLAFDARNDLGLAWAAGCPRVRCKCLCCRPHQTRTRPLLSPACVLLWRVVLWLRVGSCRLWVLSRISVDGSR